jgi:hypothetical protein
LKAFCVDFEGKVAVNVEKYGATIRSIQSDADSLVTDSERFTALRDESQIAIASMRITKLSLCERSVGTVFQLPNPDAIYSRDKEKERS